MFGKRKQRKQDLRSYHDPRNNLGVRASAYPTRDGAWVPAAYVTSENSISLQWRGKHHYNSELEAVIAAKQHIGTAISALLANTPENPVNFPDID